jgi:HSP20 family protein
MTQTLSNATDVVPATLWPDNLGWNARFNQMLDTVWHAAAHPDEFVPGVELREEPEKFQLQVDLPGIDKKDVSIDISGRRVSVSGTRTETESKGVLRHRTRVTGSFAYEVTLPSRVNEKRVSAALVDGVLSVTLPKAADTAAVHISID